MLQASFLRALTVYSFSIANYERLLFLIECSLENSNFLANFLILFYEGRRLQQVTIKITRVSRSSSSSLGNSRFHKISTLNLFKLFHEGRKC